MSRSARRRKGRPYQPLPKRRSRAWIAKLLVVAVGVVLLFGSFAIFAGAQ